MTSTEGTLSMLFTGFKELMIKNFKPPNSDKEFTIAFYVNDTEIRPPRDRDDSAPIAKLDL